LIGSVGLREASVLDQDGRPLRLSWNYTRAEIIADGVIHAIGVSLGLAGAVVLVLFTIHAAGGVQTASALIYAIGLVALLGFSAAYNMWPVSRWKWLLRRFDHSAIFLLIAATYTPFLLQMKTDAIAIGLLAGIWATALAGIALKLFLPGRFDRFSVCLYLMLGWSGALAYDSLIEPLPALTLALLALGGALYSIGVIFHTRRGLRFQNAVWHSFVLAAALCHYFAVLETVAAAQN
jgi:hemolysin III